MSGARRLRGCGGTPDHMPPRRKARKRGRERVRESEREKPPGRKHVCVCVHVFEKSLSI